MTPLESMIADHYGDTALMARIDAGLEAAGIDKNTLTPDDLAPFDEFHIGGREATEHLMSKMSLSDGDHVLDIGCGIGGAARLIAGQTGCRVTGIDLTPEYIHTAKTLTERTGLTDRVRLETASALAMPFGDESFDAAFTIHVAMNIADRAALYGEIARVVKPGAVLALFDIMRKGDGDLTYPVPWAVSHETSYLTTPDEMLALLEAAGFEVGDVEDRTAFALDFFRQRFAAAKDGPQPLGLHLVLGASGPEKLKNVFDNIEAGRIAPVQMIARRKKD